MKSRKLRNLEVSAIGYGCMGLSGGYGSAPSPKEAIQTIQATYDLGCTLFNTAEYYAMKTVNEEIVGEALQSIRNDVSIVSKFFIRDKWENKSSKDLMNELRNRLESSLKKLKTDRLDIYNQARIHPNIPVEEVAYCMGEFIKEGKILGWGLSQVNAEDISKAHVITPLTAIESEYSIMERSNEKEVIPLCEQLNIVFLAFSPLANGFLSGKIKANTGYTGMDTRRVLTRFQDDNIIANQPLLDLINVFAKEKEATPAQISLAWMLHKNDFIVPIPGSRKIDRIKENMNAVNVELTDVEFDKIEKELSDLKIHGDRKDEDIAKLFTLIENDKK